MSDVASDVERSLVAWDSCTLGDEIAHTNRASRVWHGDLAGLPIAIKLTFDGPAYVLPGLQVAAAVEAATGLKTGRPLPNASGNLACAVECGDGQIWTLSVHEFIEGEAVESFDDDLARAAARTLAVAHRGLRSIDVAVPGRLLDWFAGIAAEHPLADIAGALARIAEVPDLTMGLVYGDPSPELISQPDGNFAVIDWGTPSYGPLAYDVATWVNHVGLHSHAPEATVGVFVQEYLGGGLLRAADIAMLDDCSRLWGGLLRKQPRLGCWR